MSRFTWTNLEERSQLKQLKRYWKQHPNRYDDFIAYKYVTAIDHKSPLQAYKQISYIPNTTITEIDFDASNNLCGAGINVATLLWCLNQCRLNIKNSFKDGNYENSIETNKEFHIIKLRCRVYDIVSIPKFTDGKFRVKEAYVLGY